MDEAKTFDININLNGEGGIPGAISPIATERMSDTDFEILERARAIFANMPYGNTAVKAIGTMQSMSGQMDKFGGAISKGNAYALALMALGIAKEAHTVASAYAKSVRQSDELQKRAGIYRRNG